MASAYIRPQRITAYLRSSGARGLPGVGGGGSDHGALTGLADDDHSQYHNDARGDARYSQLGHDHGGVYDPAGTAAASVSVHAGGTGVHDIASVTGLQSALDAKIPSTEKGAAGGVAPLDGNALISSVYLPSFVDDVLEFANFAAFPATGESGKIYIAIDTSKQWRWSGSAYAEVIASPGTTDDVTEGVSNLYHTAARVRAVILTGLSLVTSSAITAADTILAALGKLQAQISALGNSAGLDIGVTAGTVAAGDDSRLSDARTPTSHASSHQSGGGDALSGLVSAQMPKWSQGSAISGTTHNAATADAGYMRPCTDGSGCEITFHSDNIAAGDCGAYRADSGGGALSWAAGGTMTVVPLTSGATSTQAAPAVLCWLCISSTLCYVWGQIE